MKRVGNQILGLVAGVCLSIMILMPYAHAETIAATATVAGGSVVTAQMEFYSGSYGAYGTGHQSVQAACDARLTVLQPAALGCTHTQNSPLTITSNSNAGTCYSKSGSSCNYYTSANVRYTCQSGYGYNGSNQSQCVNTTTIYSCPSTGGWTLSGTSCTRPNCGADQVRNEETGACVTACSGIQTLDPNTQQCVCPSAGTNAMVGGAVAYSISGSASSCFSSGATYQGCSISCTSGAGYGGTASCTGCSFTGQTGTGTTAQPVSTTQSQDPSTPQGCLAQGMGYITVGGVTTCMSPSTLPTTDPLQTIQQKTTTTTDPNNQTTTTTQQESTSVSSGGVQQTTTTVDPNGGTTTTVTQAPMTSYCTDNPSDPICTPLQDPCKDNPDRAGCKALGTPTDTEQLGTKSIGAQSINVVSFASGGACPAPVQLAHGATFSFQWLCDVAGMVKPLFIAFAWLSAGFILMGGIRQNA